MRFTYAALGCALVLLTSQSVQAQWAYDAVDALLAPGPASAVGEPLSAPGSDGVDGLNALGAISADWAGSESTPYSGQPHLTASNDQPSAEVVVHDPELVVHDPATPGGTQHKSKTTWPVDSVPEPSALAMGAVALMFFLFFARRRRLG